MFDNRFRQKVMQPLGLPVAKLLSKLGISPNQVTVLAFIISLISAYFISQNALIVGIIIWWFSRILDGLDGVLARHAGKSSSFGSFLDISLDMLAYSFIIIGFSISFSQLNSLWLFVLVGYVGCITTALSFGQMSQEAIDQNDNRGLQMAMGLAEATETGIAYTLFCLFPLYLEQLVIAWIFILFITILSRLFYAYLIYKRS